MKKVFKKSYLLQNGGCYNDNKMIKLTAPRLNKNDDIFIYEILDTSIPLTDKYYFVIKHCNLKLSKISDLMIYVANTTLLHYNSIKPNDPRVEEIMESIRTQYLTPKTFNFEVIPLQDILKEIGSEAINDTKYVTQGLYHLIDLIDIINNKEDFKYVLDESYFSLKNLIKSLVSRNDLKEDLLEHLKIFIK